MEFLIMEDTFSLYLLKIENLLLKPILKNKSTNQ